MFWRMSGLASTSPVESVLDRETYTLEELLDEDEMIQECKSLNTRLINFLRGREQVQQLLRYVVEEPTDGTDSKRAFKFPFIACEVFTCEIDVIFKTLVEDEELMGFLFSFLDPDRSHGTMLAGYFSKVVICLLFRKTIAVMHYLQAHQEILKKLVDLIGITSIMEILIRLAGADDRIYTFHADSLQWLTDTDLLEMLMDKLSPQNSSEVHANAAETLSAVTRLAQSSLALKLSSPSFVGRLFHHALEDPGSKSALVHSLSVCISLLDPKRAATIAATGAARGQHFTEPLSIANPETVDGMLQRLGDLLNLLHVSNDKEALPTTYGELKPPLGSHRLKIVEFIAVLLRTNSEGARKELVQSGAIQLVLKLFFEYPFNNMLHHHVENIVVSSIESNSKMLIDHLFVDCELVARLLAADQKPFLFETQNQPTIIVSGKAPPRIGNIGHLTRIANKLTQAGNNNPEVQEHLQANSDWSEWQSSVLQIRNSVENVFQWACGRPTAAQDHPVDNGEDDFHERDYDVSTMASNLTQEVFHYGMFDNEDVVEGHGVVERDDEDVFFDDDSAEVVISSLRLGEEQDSGQLKENMFTNSNWFAFHDDRSKQSLSTFFASPSSRLEDGQGNHNVSLQNIRCSDDGVVASEDEELADTASSSNEASSITGFEAKFRNGPCGGLKKEPVDNSIEDLSLELEKVGVSDNLPFFQNNERNLDLFSAKPPDWIGWQDSSSLEGTSGRVAFGKNNPFEVETECAAEYVSKSDCCFSQDSEFDMDATSHAVTEFDSLPPTLDHSNGEDETAVPLFEGTLQFMGVEIESSGKALEQSLREGRVGQAGPIHPHAPDS
eukprot:c26285_g1_i1 orf=661-3174(-)